MKHLDCCGDLRQGGPGMCDDCPVAAMEKAFAAAHTFLRVDSDIHASSLVWIEAQQALIAALTECRRTKDA